MHALTPTEVDFDDVQVMCMPAREDEPAAIREAWAEFEAAVGLKGRKFYGAFYPETREYHVCAQLEADDDPAALGYQVATLAGGSYLRARLKGEPPAVYELIGPTFEELTKHAEPDESRPSIEFYRSRDVIDLLLPIT